jgi:hypothetical protein
VGNDADVVVLAGDDADVVVLAGDDADVVVLLAGDDANVVVLAGDDADVDANVVEVEVDADAAKRSSIQKLWSLDMQQIKCLIETSEFVKGRCKMPHFFVIRPKAISIRIRSWDK